ECDSTWPDVNPDLTITDDQIISENISHEVSDLAREVWHSEYLRRLRMQEMEQEEKRKQKEARRQKKREARERNEVEGGGEAEQSDEEEEEEEEDMTEA
ncbi:hypothetical protein HK102_007658, partial [Quaeritorhiza haematococci]